MANKLVKQRFPDSNRCFQIRKTFECDNLADLGAADRQTTEFEANIHTEADHVEISMDVTRWYASGQTRTHFSMVCLHQDDVAALRDLLKLMDHNLTLKAQT